MDAREYNKKKCKEYYYRTKDNLSEEVKQKRREQAKIRARVFYSLNRELCRNKVQIVRKLDKKEYIEKIKNLYNKISTEDIKYIRSLNLIELIKKKPRLKMWDKKINDWTYADFYKLKAIIEL